MRVLSREHMQLKIDIKLDFDNSEDGFHQLEKINNRNASYKNVLVINYKVDTGNFGNIYYVLR